MTKRDRVIAAINGKTVDHVPCSFSLHFPKEKAFGEAGIKSHLDFFSETDTDILKIMNENLVPSCGSIITGDDYCNRIKPVTLHSPFMQEQIQFTKEILDKADPTAFSIGTLHGTTASCIHPLEKMGMPYGEARIFLVEMLRKKPKEGLAAMQRIVDGMCELAQGYIAAGLDGVYFASLGAEKRYFTDEEFAEWIAPLDMQIMQAVKDANGYCFLHMCKDGLEMERYRNYAPLADVVNWGVFEAPLSLEEGRRLFPGKTILGGLPNRSGVLVDGSDNQIKKAVKDIIKTFSGKGIIVGADCTLATEQDMHKLHVAVEACRK